MLDRTRCWEAAPRMVSQTTTLLTTQRTQTILILLILTILWTALDLLTQKKSPWTLWRIAKDLITIKQPMILTRQISTT